MKTLSSGKSTYLNSILKIAVPIILGNIINQIQMLVDRSFLGHVNDLYMSVLGNVSTPVWTTCSVIFSLVSGASILISQKVGSKDTEKCMEYSSSLLKWINVLPVLLFFFWIFCGKFVFRRMGISENMMPMCLEYLYYFSPIFLLIGYEASTMVVMQTSNYTKPMVWFGLVRSGLNIILDWVMIFGHLGCPAMGIKGAALATTISEFAGCIYCTFIFVTTDKLFTRPPLMQVIKAPLKPFLASVKLGINTAFEDFAWNLGNLVLIVILNGVSEKAAGIYSMIFGIEILVVVVIAAVGSATMTLSGEARGASNREKYVSVCKIAYLLSVAVSLLLLAICLAIPRQIISIFTNDPELVSGCGLYLILMCINLFSKSGNIIFGNCIRGAGDTAWMFMTQIFGTVLVISCAVLFVKVLGLGIAGVFLAVITDEFCRAVVNLMRVRSKLKTFEK